MVPFGVGEFTQFRLPILVVGLNRMFTGGEPIWLLTHGHMISFLVDLLDLAPWLVHSKSFWSAGSTPGTSPFPAARCTGPRAQRERGGRGRGRMSATLKRFTRKRRWGVQAPRMIRYTGYTAAFK